MPEPPLRVCLLIGKYPPLFSGQGIQIQRSLPYLRARGIEVTVLTSRLPVLFKSTPEDGPDIVDRLLARGEGHLSMPKRAYQLRRYFAPRRAWFDVVHSDLLGWEFLLNIRYLESLGLPMLVEMVLLGGDDPHTISREHFGSFKISLLKRVDLWVGLSRAFLPRLPAAGIAADRFRLAYPGVDLQAYRPLTADERRSTRSRLGLPADARIVVSVGSVIRRKGIDRTLETWARLPPRAGRDLLVVVGPASSDDGLERADQGFAQAVRARSDALDLKGTVRWVGRAENVNDYLGAADLFLFLSRQEGLGIVILEALSCGLPCVVSPLDGIAAEIILNGRSGVIVDDPDDAAAVAASVSRLLDQPQTRTEMGASARRTAVERFSFEARADALACIYRSLAAGPPR